MDVTAHFAPRQVAFQRRFCTKRTCEQLASTRVRCGDRDFLVPLFPGLGWVVFTQARSTKRIWKLCIAGTHLHSLSVNLNDL
jgi:hypothetical protein